MNLNAGENWISSKNPFTLKWITVLQVYFKEGYYNSDERTFLLLPPSTPNNSLNIDEVCQIYNHSPQNQKTIKIWIFACRCSKVSLKQINMVSWLLKCHFTNSLKQKKKDDMIQLNVIILVSWLVILHKELNIH